MTDSNEINPTQAIILAILHGGAASGASVEQETRSLDGHWNVTRSQVYRELPKLIEMGYVVKLEADASMRWATPYAITETGRLAYQDWFINAKVSAITRDPWMLRHRLSGYTGITDEEARSLQVDAVDALQEALQLESSKEKPDPILLSRYQTALAWFSGALS